MRVTIIVDASFCPDTNAAGYGYWIACGRGKLGGGCEFLNTVENNIAAEMYAVVNAMYIAVYQQLVLHGDEILMQTDCMSAIDSFTGKRKVLPQAELVAVETLQRLKVHYNLRVTFRHVKGHTQNKEPRFVTNKMCDRRAKEHMRKARARLLESIE